MVGNGNPHTTCAQLLDNLRSSGLTFTLNETPYSVYLTVRKKFTKEYSPSNHAPPIGEHEPSKCAGADVLAQLLQDEINNHNVTKFELSETDDKLRRSVECNSQNVEEYKKQHLRQIATIAQLTEDLAKEVDEHEQSENELRKLEAKVDTLKNELEDVVKQKEDVVYENESLRGKLEDAEQEIENSHKVRKSQSEKLLQYEFKHAELATLDTALLKKKVADLETKIAGKERVISHLNNQAKLSLREITKLRQSHPDFESSDTTKITPESLVSQLDTPSGISQIGTNPVSTLATKAKALIENVDINKNARPDINPEHFHQLTFFSWS